eukprot:TRINITY_DN24131_c0_g1_i1.p1 TRINITY_DN24131_c0_g1~~TRINITY_DN24131_c0_g1_i1.p1  ORF type:complete len:406 (+),score=71.87 TRINITY_DN24131_c0_g1_i1:483-1700(+)
MLIRIRSRDGLERVTLPADATVASLKAKIADELTIPVNAQILSTSQHLLLSKSPSDYTDLSNDSAQLSSLGLSHGSVVFLAYSGERTKGVAPPPAMTPAGFFGRHMTVEDMIARQTRIERQEKAHCELVSFDRDAANVFQQYVHSNLAFSIKRGGFMFGTVSGENNEMKVDFIYEPPQQGSEEGLSIFRDPDEEKRVKLIAAGLGLQLVGFVFTQSVGAERDFTLSNAEIRQAAELNAEAEDPRHFAVGMVKLDTTEEGEGEVHFEAFQLSDQCVKLFKEGWFVDSEETPAKLSKMKSEVIVLGKDAHEVDNDFFLVPVRIGDHEGPLKTTFPVENRILPPSEVQLRQHLERTRGQMFSQRLADFHLLLFLSRYLDATTDIPQLTEAVRTKGPVADGYQLIIESL